MQVKHRRVLHVQGYDPRGVAEYHDRFEREHRRTCELYGLTGAVGAPKETRDGLSASWDVSTKGDRLAGRNPLHAAALGRPRAQGHGTRAVVEDRADVSHRRRLHSQRRLRPHVAGELALRPGRHRADSSDYLLGAARLLRRHFVHEPRRRARRAGDRGENRRPYHRLWRLCLDPVAYRANYRLLLRATKLDRSINSSAANVPTGASVWTRSPAMSSMPRRSPRATN